MHAICRLQVMLAEHVRDALIGCKHCFLDKPRCLGALAHRYANWLVILVKHYARLYAFKIY